MFKLNEIKNKASSFLGNYEQKDPTLLAAAEQAVGGLLILDGIVGIDNPFGGKKRSGIFGALIGVILGTIILLFGGSFFNLFGTKDLTADTTGHVTSIGAPQTHISTDNNGNKSTSTSCSLNVRYTVGEKEYSQPTKSASSDNCNATVGSNVAIKYNPNNPSDYDTAGTVNTINTIKKFLPFIGLFILLVSLVTFTIRLLSIIFGWKLLRHGRNLAKTLPNSGNIGSQISQIQQEFKKTFFNGNGGAVSTIESAVGGDNTQQHVTPIQMPPNTPSQSQ